MTVLKYFASKLSYFIFSTIWHVTLFLKSMWNKYCDNIKYICIYTQYIAWKKLSFALVYSIECDGNFVSKYELDLSCRHLVMWRQLPRVEILYSTNSTRNTFTFWFAVFAVAQVCSIICLWGQYCCWYFALCSFTLFEKALASIAIELPSSQ